MPELLNPWDCRDGESSPAYEAFRVYLKLGGKRSLVRVKEVIRKAYGLIAKWSSEWGWVERARAFDTYMMSAEKDQIEEISRARAVLWSDRRHDECSSLNELSLKLRERALAMLRVPLEELEWTLADLVKLAKTSAELRAMAIIAALEECDDFDPFTASPEECRAYAIRKLGEKRLGFQER